MGRCNVRGLLLWAACASLWAGGCGGVGPQVNKAPKVDVVAGDAFRSDGTGERVKFTWWKGWRQAELDALCARLVTNNLDLKRASARIAQAKALLAAQRGVTLPTVAISGQLARSQQNFFFGSGSQGKAFSISQVTFPVSLQVNWEVDLWGRQAHLTAAQGREVAAMGLERDAAIVSLSARLAEAWLSVREGRARLELLSQQEDLNRKLLKLLELRFGQGLANSLDILQQRAQLEAVSAQRPLIEQSVQLATAQVKVLLGLAPSQSLTLAPENKLPRLAELPSTGLPASLLSRRPDVLAAQQRLIASDHRFASAKVSLLPAIRLGASAGFQGRADPFGFLENFVSNLVAGLTAPLFQGGRLRAQARAQKSAAQEAALAYAQVAQRALWEVDNALVRDRQQGLRLKALQRQLAAAQATLEQAQNRFASGQTSYLAVIQALGVVQRLETEQLIGRRQQLSARVDVFRALAGRPPLRGPKAEADARVKLVQPVATGRPAGKAHGKESPDA